MRWLFIITACLPMMAFAAGSTNSAVYSAQISPTDEPREVIIKAQRALKSIKSLRWRMESYCDDQHSSVVMEITRSGRAHSIVKDGEAIFIGRDVYKRKGKGPWKKWPGRNIEGTHAEATSGFKAASSTEDFSRVPESDDAELRKRYRDAKFIGREILDNVPVLVYQYRVYYESSNKLFSTNKIWTGEQDGLPHRVETEFEAEVSKHANPPCNKTKTVITYYDFNAEIVIEPPLLPPAKTADEAPPQVSVDVRPIPLNSPIPRYTDAARKNKIQGTVRVRGLIGADGSVKQVRMVRGLPDGLQEEAIRAAYQMRFRPALKDGKPVEFWQAVDVDFSWRSGWPLKSN